MMNYKERRELDYKLFSEFCLNVRKNQRLAMCKFLKLWIAMYYHTFVQDEVNEEV